MSQTMVQTKEVAHGFRGGGGGGGVYVVEISTTIYNSKSSITEKVGENGCFRRYKIKTS